MKPLRINAPQTAWTAGAVVSSQPVGALRGGTSAYPVVPPPVPLALAVHQREPARPTGRYADSDFPSIVH
ncbi:hypothetical protein [Micromonospora sp. MH99]|uniref:hypothetical protein n=1 Tax=Micromonospora sp. MH99 TaxID=1945510 RepID=UPI001F1AEA40|nr:hypothetical protein [Micromonospora sp. MH99]MCF0095384.1 hypothetical protein [Micromonospora sp. MH99]